MFQTDLLIGGKSLAASNQVAFERRNPATGEVASRAAAASMEDADQAIETAQQAFPD
jgi:vanillin dehydrogenase